MLENKMVRRQWRVTSSIPMTREPSKEQLKLILRVCTIVKRARCLKMVALSGTPPISSSRKVSIKSRKRTSRSMTRESFTVELRPALAGRSLWVWLQLIGK